MADDPDVDDIWPAMHWRLAAMLNDPDARALNMFVVSGFRSLARQAQLFADAVHKYGSPQAAGKWVAPPGRSNHGPSIDVHGNHVNDQVHQGRWGGAVDLGVKGTSAVAGQWPIVTERRANQVAARYGLYSPMDWEDWHFEQIPGWNPPAAPQGAPIAPDAAGAAMPLIGKGAIVHGPVVALWQQLLIDHAAQHQVVADSDFGPVTIDATHNFEKIAGLPIEDVVRPPTWARMLTLTH